ncbi:MAG: GMC family oxidoreductase [Acidobacteria bacterium]|nr:GMC family oxidoreductase [Acidobacteriota bacterium]
MAEKNYDLIVVGSGMAGFLLAARIAEKGVNPRNGEPLRVALVERGPYVKGTPKSGYGVPERRRLFTNITREFHENGRYQMQFFPDGPKGPNSFPHSAASVVGGGSLHWRAQTRVPADMDYRAWSEVHGLKDWTEDNFRESAEEVVRMFNIHSRPDSLLNRGDLMFRDAGRALGYEVVDAQVAKRNCVYCWGCEGTNFCKYDSKLGSFIAYLAILEKHNVDVIAEAEAQKIVIEKGQARGVLYSQKGTFHQIDAPKILVSCGNFGTPLLLMRSGYGPRDLLGARTLVDNPNVGRNIDGRPGPMPLTGIFPEPITDGAYTDGGFYVIGDTRADRVMERVQFRWESPTAGDPSLLAIHPEAPPFGKEHKEFMRDICNVSVPSGGRDAVTRRGTILVRIVRPLEVFGTEDDRGGWRYDTSHPSIQRVFRQSREIGHEILKKMGAREILPSKEPLGTSFNSNTGSCRAGTDRRTSVVNPYFESHDVENLLICDACAAPRGASIGYGAPTATVAAFAYRQIVARHFSR